MTSNAKGCVISGGNGVNWTWTVDYVLNNESPDLYIRGIDNVAYVSF